jgi:hypothetical protein
MSSQPAERVEPESTVTVYLTNGTRTSQGPGPGPKTLPAGEASALVRLKYAVYGPEPPDAFAGRPEPAVRRFA